MRGKQRNVITKDMIDQAKKLREQGFVYHHIAEAVGCSAPQIYRIINGKRYKGLRIADREKKTIEQSGDEMPMRHDNSPSNLILNAITFLQRGDAGYRVIKGQIVYTLNGVIVNVAEIMRDAQQMGYQRGGTARYEGNERSLITNSEEKFRAAIARSKTPAAH